MESEGFFTNVYLYNEQHFHIERRDKNKGCPV